MSNAIFIEQISKLYRLGEIGTGSLAHDVNRWWHKMAEIRSANSSGHRRLR